MKAIQNGRCILPDETGAFTLQTGKIILYDEDAVRAVVKEKDFDAAECEEILDAGGRYVAPGFINVHIHGCAGSDTMDDDPAAIRTMQRFLPQTGVTSFLPTTMTCAWADIAAALGHVRAAMNEPPAGARVLGAHMEGPFISAEKKGSQDARHILPADWSRLEPYADVVRIVTVAPETLPDDTFARRCQKAGIRVSIGHTAADYETAVRAVREQGIGRFTHLYDAMSAFHHRAPGAVGAAFDTDARVELITDNVHSCPAAQRLVWKVKGRGGILLITDSLRACGVGDGPSELGGQKVLVRGELATLEDGTIAGSVAAMNRCVRFFRENTGASVPEVIELVTKNPAEDLGLYDQLGSIAPGKRADFAIFDEEIRIFAAIVGGRCRWQAG